MEIGIDVFELLRYQIAAAHGEERSRAQDAVLTGYIDRVKGEDSDPCPGYAEAYLAGYSHGAGTYDHTYSSLACELLNLQALMRYHGDLANDEAEKSEFVVRPITDETFDEIPF